MTTVVQEKPRAFPIPAGVFAETVTMVTHYTDRLFRFRMTRPPSFRFRSGEFVMIGLPNAEKAGLQGLFHHQPVVGR